MLLVQGLAGSLSWINSFLSPKTPLMDGEKIKYSENTSMPNPNS
jgi:hypothetical protein